MTGGLFDDNTPHGVYCSGDFRSDFPLLYQQLSHEKKKDRAGTVFCSRGYLGLSTSKM